MSNNYSSFDYKWISEDIRKILEQRSRTDNTIQIAAPFIKATSTIEIEEYLGKGNVGFTMGIHGFPSETALLEQDINAPRTSEGLANPLVGYTYTPGAAGAYGKAKPIFAKAPLLQTTTINNLFDSGVDVYSNVGNMADLLSTPHSFEAPYIHHTPPPGIVQANVSRNKNGLVASARLNILIPNLLQLEFLHRTFLIPSVGIVLEWGQQFAPGGNLGESGLNTAFIDDKMFPWYNRAKLDIVLEKLKTRGVGLPEILDCYTYPSQGQYGWTFGRLANMNIKSNSDGSFNAELMIYGQSEEAFAYSTRSTIMTVPRTAIPANNNRGGAASRSSTATSATTPSTSTAPPTVCLEDVDSVFTYFTSTTNGRNFKTLLDNVRSGRQLPKWKSHVKFFSRGNVQPGEPVTDTQSPTTSQKNFGDGDDAYFISWRFFVNVILNHPEYGIRAIFQDTALTPDAKKRIALIEPYVPNGSNYPTFDADGKYKCDVCNDPISPYIFDSKESFVGYNRYLRSVNPSVMLIVNEPAAEAAASDSQRNRKDGYNRPLYADTNTSRDFRTNGAGEFDKSTLMFYDDTSRPKIEDLDRGFLSAGVWINHKAIVRSMASSDSIIQGVAKLLNSMNQATNNFWELTLDSSEPVYRGIDICEGNVPTDPNQTQSVAFRVVDAKWRTDSNSLANEFNKIHTFNKLVRQKSIDGVTQLLGSDVIECNVDLSLPKIMFAQLATLGIAQPNAIPGIEGSPSSPTQCVHGSISDPSEALRQMFSITSIAPTLVIKDEQNKVTEYKSPDRTHPSSPAVATNPRNSQPCRPIQQPPAQAGGTGRPAVAGSVTLPDPTVASGGVNFTGLPEDLAQLQTEINKLLESPACTECLTCTSAAPPRTPVFPSIAALNANLPINTQVATLNPDSLGNLEKFVRAMKAQGQTNLRYVLAAISKGYSETGFETAKLTETNYTNTDNTQIRFALGVTASELDDQKLNELKRNPENFFNYMYSNRRRPGLGNTAPTDGYRYRGRGFIGITGKGIYSTVQRASGNVFGGVNIVENPNILGTDVDIAAKASAVYLKATLGEYTRLLLQSNPANLPTGINFAFDTMTQEDAFILTVSQIGGTVSWKVSNPDSVYTKVLATVRGFYAKYLAPGQQLRSQVVQWLGVSDVGEGGQSGTVTTPQQQAPSATYAPINNNGQRKTIQLTDANTVDYSNFPSIKAIQAAGHRNGRLNVTMSSRLQPIKEYWSVDSELAKTQFVCYDISELKADRIAGLALDKMLEYAAVDSGVRRELNTNDRPIVFAVCTGYVSTSDQAYRVLRLGPVNDAPSQNSDPVSRTENGTKGSADIYGAAYAGWGVAFELFAVGGTLETRWGVPWFEGAGTAQVSDIRGKTYTRISETNTPLHWRFLQKYAPQFNFKQSPTQPWTWVYTGPMTGTFTFAGAGQIFEQIERADETIRTVSDAVVIEEAGESVNVRLGCSDEAYGKIGAELGVERTVTPAAGATGAVSPGAAVSSGINTLPVPVRGPTYTNNQIAAGKDKCRECAIASAQAKLLTIRQQQIAAANVRFGRTIGTAPTFGERPLRTYEGLSSLFRYYETAPDLMVTNIRCDSNGIRANAFGAAPGPLTLSANLTIPGIAGLRIGELFWIDRIPAFYKAFGAFQIISLEDEIGLEGWQTKIEARFNYLGRAWQDRILQLLRTQTGNPQATTLVGETSPTTGTTTVPSGPIT